jgi:uncharacterized membrane protein YcgQ (UPF0703/DUF1980 family)
MERRSNRFLIILICILVAVIGMSGCSKRQSASLNNRMKEKASASDKASDINLANAASGNLDDASQGADEAQVTEEADPEYQAFLNSLGQEDTQKEDTEIEDTQEGEAASTDEKDFGPPDATGRVGYHYDIEDDKKNFDGKVDIVVGDNLYTTQINDWYTNFDRYEGKTVEIEGYYINDYAPYTFVGRYGPSCPYCNGGYVSFEFYTQDDLSELKSVEDWIKVTGILRQGEDTNGVFYYIEVLSIEKMDKVGKDTVTN